MLGLLETLTTPHSPDRYLQLLDRTWSVRAVRARVLGVEHRTASTVTVTLRPNRNFAGFRAGQHVLVALEVDGARRTRCYSMANSEHDRRTLELTARVEPGGQISPRMAALRVGDVVELSQAQGPFTLPVPRPERVLLISGGSGITPVLSMARTLADEGRAATVTFVHYARTLADVAYAAELDSLAAQGVTVLRSYTRSTGAGSGELHGHFARDHVPSHDVPTWICGPSSLIDAVRSEWTDTGRTAPLAVEYFVPPVVDVPADDTSAGRLTFAGAGLEVDGTTEPILVQAESAGLAPEHGCRMGICFSCTRRLCSGTVLNTTTGELTSAAPAGDGDPDIQICVTRPLGAVTVDL